MTGRWIIPPSVAALSPLARAWLRINQRFGYAPTDAQIWERDAWVRIQEDEALTYRQNRNAAKARRRALRAAR